MNIRSIARSVTSTVALVVAVTATAAYSQSDVTTALQAKLAAGATKLEKSCGDEIKNFCSTVTPGEGRVVLCMEAHEDKLSPKCLFDMHEAAKYVSLATSAMKDATSACRDDVAKTCGKTAAGQGRIIQCLMTNKASISQACAASLQKLSDLAGN